MHRTVYTANPRRWVNHGKEKFISAIARISPTIAAYLDWLEPAKHVSWGGPMNGQRHRQQTIRNLVALMQPQAIVETGTYRGTTAEFLADISGSPVYTVEIDRRSYDFAKWRFAGRSDVLPCRADSRTFLRRLLANPSIPKERVLFYLDAHWRSDLPLMEELTIIAPNWRESVIVIDDFQVPGDSGYGFDDYGEQGRLTRDCLPELSGWVALYPSAASVRETGARRGYVVLYPLGAFALDDLITCGLMPAYPQQAGGGASVE